MNDTPYNAITGIEYQGYNVMFLNMARKENNYTSNKWATFLQWKDAGYKLENAKGKGIHCRTFGENEKKEKYIKYFVVFNADLAVKVTKEVPSIEFSNEFVLA